MVGKFKSFATFVSERPGDIPLGVLSFPPESSIVHAKPGKPNLRSLAPESGTPLSGPISVAG